MRTPRDFFRPLAIGAPAPLREIPFPPSRMVHFFDPSSERMVAKLPQIGQQSALIGASLVPQMQTDMLQRFCRKIDCNQDQMKRFRPQIG